MHGVRLERADRSRGPDHQRRIAERIEFEALDGYVNVFPALNAVFGNLIAAGNDRHVNTDGRQMGDDGETMPKEVGAIVANHENPISGAVV
ncbi:hypothetical protein [Bradyrhizobium sp. AUGA SZCCT0177]|uniref:hypothetical protein n=1 Tax=Bradyrhizobium sp. AUGA SZCCT0177 TaxID=2807665 RepID=UPI002012FC93|nr:hypothetical protein [Bradyrhizobium sp. AUGA SZCCT0177]